MRLWASLLNNSSKNPIKAKAQTDLRPKGALSALVLEMRQREKKEKN